MARFEPEKLKSLLEELLSHKKLPIPSGKLARTLIEKTYGFQYTSYYSWHNPFFLQTRLMDMVVVNVLLVMVLAEA